MCRASPGTQNAKRVSVRTRLRALQAGSVANCTVLRNPARVSEKSAVALSKTSLNLLLGAPGKLHHQTGRSRHAEAERDAEEEGGIQLGARSRTRRAVCGVR